MNEARLQALRAQVDEKVAECECRSAPDATPQPLPDEPDHHRNAPRPDEACLYGLIGDIARAGSATTEANPFAIALNAMVYLGCCFGRGPFMPVGNTWHHARLFGLHVGRTSKGRKGDALALLHRIDMRLGEKHPSLKPQVHRGGLSSREGLIFLIHDGFKEGRNEVEPIHDKRLWVNESEFSNVLHQTKRDGNTLSAALRDCWDGVPLKPATKSARISTTHPHVGMSAAVTPGELLALIERKELTNGFANRFLMIFSERQRLVPRPTATPQHEVDDLARRVADVLAFAHADRWVDRDCLQMTPSAEAWALYEALYRSELNRDDFGPLVTAILERRAPTLLRIAMILALTDKTNSIELHHLQAALAWIRYWTDSVRYIFSSAAAEAEEDHISAFARRIVEFLSARGRQSRSAISRDCFHGKVDKNRLDAALDQLLATTPPTISVQAESRKGGPGAGTKFYELTANSAKRAKSEDSRGFAADFASSEVSEAWHGAADRTGPDFARLRSLRQHQNWPETSADPHTSVTSLISPAHADDAEVEIE